MIAQEVSMRIRAFGLIVIMSFMICQPFCFAAHWSWVSSSRLDGAADVFRMVEGADGALYAGTAPNGDVLKSSDGGANWSKTSDLPGAKSILGLFCAADGAIYAGTAPYGAVFKTVDGGARWIEVASFADATEVKSFAQASDGVLYAGTGPYGKVYKSSDNGAAWVKTAELPGAEYVYSLLATSDDAVYAGAAGRVFKTTDGGLSWQNTAGLPAAEYIYSLLQASDGSVYAGGAGSVFKTTDGGASWMPLGRLSDRSYAVFTLMQDSDGAIYATTGTDGGIYRLGDSGWHKVATLTETDNVYALLRSVDGNVYASGRGVILAYAPLIALKVSSATGESFAVEVAVERISRSFDAYCVLLGPGVTYSLVPGMPARLVRGVHPLASGVPGLRNPLSHFRFTVPGLPAGEYTVVAGLVPPGVVPTGAKSALPGYVAAEKLSTDSKRQ
jgi:photosystem II stability/assembly factor-like uncharacterized protein